MTAGLKCAPDIGPNVRIKRDQQPRRSRAYWRAARSATFPPANRSPMMPEPTTAASRKAVPEGLSYSTPGHSTPCGFGFTARINALMNLFFHLRRDRVHVDAFAGEKLSRILDAVDAGRLNVDQVKPGVRELADVFVFFQRARDTAHPHLHAVAHLRRHFASRRQRRTRRNGRLASRRGMPRAAPGSLSAREVNHAIGNDDID